MALRRRIGNLAEILLKQNLEAQQMEDQDKLIRQRQAELSRQGAEQQILGKVLGDDKGQMVERLLSGGVTSLGGVNLSGLRHTREDAQNRVGERISAADSLDKVMDPASIVNAYQSEAGASNVAPGGSNQVDPTTGLIPTPKRTAIEDLLAQNQAKRMGLQRAAAPVQRKGIDQAGVGYEETVNPFDDIGVARQTERTGTQEGAREGEKAVGAAPGVAGAQNLIEDQTRAGKVRTAAGMAGAQQAAQTAGEAARLKQSWELAAADPHIKSIAEQVLLNPEQLKLVPAKDRGYVMAALQSDKFKTQTQRATQQMLDTAWTSLQQLRTEPGMEGAVGFRLTDPSRWTYSGEPIGGTDAANYTAIFNQFKAALTLPKLEYLRGLGHMSDLEFGTVAKAATQMSPSNKEEFFSKQMPVVEEVLRNAYKRAGLPVPDAVGGGYQSPAQQKRRQLQ